jgi:hypothetical protein
LIAHEDVIVFKAAGDRAQEDAIRRAGSASVRHEYGAIGPGHWAA